MRTSDGAIVKGKPPFANVNYGGRFNGNETSSRTPPFRPNCYQAKSAKSATFEGRAVEAISLRGTCKDTNGEKSDTDFDTLYVDPRSHDPVAATASETPTPSPST